jgi:SAM-dependent methyltransferase
MDKNSYSEKKYDIIISFETFEHLKNPDAYLQNLFSVLKTGGKLILSTPNKLVSSPEHLEWDFHEFEYTPIQLRDIVINSGFKNLKFFGQKTNENYDVLANLKNELDKISFNPLFRLGKLIKRVFKSEIPQINILDSSLSYSIEEDEVEYLESIQKFGPDVTIVVCEK